MENCGTASSVIADRVRDPFFNGTSQLNVISLMSRAQQVTNGILSDVVQSASLTVQPRSLIYQLSAFVPSAVVVLAVADASGRDLDPLKNIEMLQWLDMQWVQAVADAPRGFIQVGGDLLIVYPGVNRTQTLTVKYSQYLADLRTTADSTVVQNEVDTCVNALTEALLLLKGRDLNAVQATMERFSSRIAELKAERR